MGLKTYTPDELKVVLDTHRKWLRGEEGGERANLSGANLIMADLSGANLIMADLSRADLRGAYLPTGETWEIYLREVVPELCSAGGVALEKVAPSWECHSWENCPMHAAFGASSHRDVPVLLRPRSEQFVQLFDAGLIPPLRRDGDRWTCLPAELPTNASS